MAVYMWTDTEATHLIPMLPDIKAAHVDVVMSYRISSWSSPQDVSDYLDAAHEAGLKVILSSMGLGRSVVYNRPDKTLSPSELATLASFVSSYASHPALLGFYTDDEGNGVDNEYMAGGSYPISTRTQVYETIKSVAPAALVLEAHFALSPNSYSEDVHDVFAIHAGRSANTSYVYVYSSHPDPPDFGCIDQLSGEVVQPLMWDEDLEAEVPVDNESLALTAFEIRLAAMKTYIGDTAEVIALLGVFGAEQYYAMPPASGPMAMFERVQATGLDRDGVGWFLWESRAPETLTGVSHEGYEARVAGVTAVNALYLPPTEVNTTFDGTSITTTWVGSGTFEVRRRFDAGTWSDPVAATSPYVDDDLSASWDTAEYEVRAVVGGSYSEWVSGGVVVNVLLYDLLVSGAPANPLPDATDDGTGSDTAALGTVRPLPDATDAGYGTDEAELAAAVDALFFDLLVSGIPSGELGALTDAGEGGDVATLGAIRPLPGVVDAGEGGDGVRDEAALNLPLSATAIRRGFTATVTRKQHTAELTNRRGQQ